MCWLGFCVVYTFVCTPPLSVSLHNVWCSIQLTSQTTMRYIIHIIFMYKFILSDVETEIPFCEIKHHRHNAQ